MRASGRPRFSVSTASTRWRIGHAAAGGGSYAASVERRRCHRPAPHQAGALSGPDARAVINPIASTPTRAGDPPVLSLPLARREAPSGKQFLADVEGVLTIRGRWTACSRNGSGLPRLPRHDSRQPRCGVALTFNPLPAGPSSSAEVCPACAGIRRTSRTRSEPGPRGPWPDRSLSRTSIGDV